MTTNGGQAASQAHLKGKVMHEDEVQEEHELVDVDVRPVQEKNAGMGRTIAGGVAVVLALLAGGIALSNLGDDGTEVAVAESNDDEVVEDAADDADAATSEAVEELDDDVFEDAAFASDAAVGFGFGPGNVVFADGGFVSLGGGPDGITVSRSENGTEWSSANTVGFPEGAQAFDLVQTDSGWVTVAQVWPEPDEDESSFFFGPGEQPERVLGFSEDLINWTTTELPGIDAEENQYVGVNGIAALGDQVAILIQVEPGGPDELRILFENGHLTEADLEYYCGGGFEGDDFVAYTCEFIEEAIEDEFPVTTTTVPAGELIEPLDGATTTTQAPAVDDVSDSPTTTAAADVVGDGFGGEEELLRVTPGQPGYDELFEAFNSFEDFEMPTPLVASGTVGGEFTVTELPATGYNTSLVSTEQTFVTQVQDFDSGRTVILTSADGTDWTQTGEIGVEGNIDRLVASGDRLLAVGQTFGESGPDSNFSTWISDDQGATWTQGTLETALFGPYGTPLAGPAGFAVKLQGPTEPYEDDLFDPFADAEPVDVVVDGYTMTLNLSDGSSSLIDPDGTVIYENISQEDVFTGQADEIVRLEGRFMDTTVWLDPETGEDLVTIPSDVINEAVDAILSSVDFGPESDFVEPPQGSEIWFSPDGNAWTLIQSDAVDFEQGYTGLVAVGDDELVLRTDTFVEPPAELLIFEEENREPTDAEIEALDAWSLESSEESIEWSAIPVG